MRTALVVLALSGLMAASSAWAQARKAPERAPLAPPKVWLAREIAQLTEQQVWLFGADGSSVGVARTEQLRTLLAVFGKLESQSGISSELYLSEGNDPDTWLAQGKGDQIIIRVSLGLVTMIGNDWDAWAFVLGHQLAHIDVFMRERAELQKREIGVPAPPKMTQDDEEKVADGLALDWAIKAGHKPDGAVLFLTRLASRASASSLFMRRHPFYPGRLDYVRDLGATLSVPTARREIKPLPQ